MTNMFRPDTREVRFYRLKIKRGPEIVFNDLCTTTKRGAYFGKLVDGMRSLEIFRIRTANLMAITSIGYTRRKFGQLIDRPLERLT